MDDNNFTYLEDIIDLDEPGNESESDSRNKMYSNYSQPPPNISTSHDFNSVRGMMSTQEMFNQKPRNVQSQPQYLPKSEQYSHYGPYTPASKVNNFPHKFLEMQPVQPEIPSYKSSKKSTKETMLTDHKIQELTTKYDELCYICKKLNDKDRVRYHYVYNIIIIFLFLIILMLVKKVLNI